MLNAVKHLRPSRRAKAMAQRVGYAQGDNKLAFGLAIIGLQACSLPKAKHECSNFQTIQLIDKGHF